MVPVAHTLSLASSFEYASAARAAVSLCMHTRLPSNTSSFTQYGLRVQAVALPSSFQQMLACRTALHSVQVS
jgi:hypothetical protein